jgi:hypothetical protein
MVIALVIIALIVNVAVLALVSAVIATKDVALTQSAGE